MSLSAHAVSLTVGGVPLLSDITLDIAPGTVTTIMGPNGAGKTSLIRILTGERKPSSGRVTLCGQPLGSVSPNVRATSLAVLPQHSVLDFPFSAEEVVRLGRIPHSTGTARDEEISREALALVDGAYLASREFTRLSGGERQRVHLARALAQIWEPVEAMPRLLVLDEPTASFDLAHQRLTRDIVRHLAESGVGVAMVVHDLNFAARCADQMVFLQCGNMAGCGVPDDVLTPELVRQVFSVEVEIGRHEKTDTPLVITS